MIIHKKWHVDYNMNCVSVDDCSDLEGVVFLYNK